MTQSSLWHKPTTVPVKSYTQSAIVIGGSIAGLLAARVLANHFDRVTIIERDQLPAQPVPRKGIPQARHIHILLIAGLRILETLFPNISQNLSEAGAIPINWTEDVPMLSSTGWSGTFPSDLISYTCSRDLLEWVVRQRLLQDVARVRFLTGYQVSGVTMTADKGRVNGVCLQSRRQEANSEIQDCMKADFIVDASGRGSKMAAFLEQFGYEPPPETKVNSFLGYATRWYEAPDHLLSGYKGVVLHNRPPELSRGAGLLPAENGRWTLTLAGIAGDYPPTDDAGFAAFVDSLPDPILSNFIRHATPITPIYGYRRTENRWRHYERMSRLPAGIVALGDATCAFNPIYGQGMSLSAKGAIVLDAILKQHGNADDMPHHFHRQLAKALHDAWLLATGEDFRWTTTEGNGRNWATRLAHRYMDRVKLVMPHHPEITRTFLEVIHLLTSPQALFKPSILKQVLFDWRKYELPSHPLLEQRSTMFKPTKTGY